MLLLQGAKNKLVQLAFSREGNLLAVPVWKKGVQIWHPHYGAETVTTIHDKSGATEAVFTSSGHVFIQGNHTYFLLHDSMTHTTRKVESGYAYHAGVCPNGHFFVAAEWGDQGTGGWFFCRSLSTPDENVWRKESDRAAVSSPIFLKGDSVVTFESARAGTVCVLRDLSSGEIRDEVNNLIRQPQGSTVSPDGLLWATRDRHIVLVYSADVLSEPVAWLRSPTKKGFTGHAFHPSGQYLLVSSVDQSVTVYDTATWQVARVYDWGVGKLFSVAVSPDGTLAAAGGDKGQIVLWDWE